jgi:putative two-component system response regulator
MNQSNELVDFANLPMPQVLTTLEHAYFHQVPTREIGFFLTARESLFNRFIIEQDRQSHARALILIARSCFAAAAPRDGLVALARAEDIAIALPISDLHRQIQTVKGNLYMDLGDFASSFDAHSSALTISRQFENAEAEARTIANLSGLFLDFGAYWDALKLGERVLDIHREHPLAANIITTALNNMTESCLATHQPERGIELGSRVVMRGVSGDAVSRAHICIAHTLLARLHLMRGRVTAAERELLIARELEQSTGFSRARLKVNIAQALIDHEKGRLRQAVQSLKETLVLAGADAGIAKDALSALVTIYEKEGHPKSALRYLQRLSAMTERANLEFARERLSDFGLSARDAKDTSRVEASSISVNDFRLQTASLRKQLTDSQIEVLERLAIAAEMRDDVTGLHCYRVGKWAQLIALELGLPAQEADAIEIAARLHDIGKVGVPDHILLKPGKLTEAEFEMLKRHAVLGARLLSRSKTPQIRLAEKVALTHHERWNGLGYPQGLRGEDIPLAGRITAVADVFDALTHIRPYKHAWPMSDALREIRENSGSWFDSSIVEAFFRVVERLQLEDDNLDHAIESKLKRSRIMRIREYVIQNNDRAPSFEDSGTFTVDMLTRPTPIDASIDRA